MDKPPAITAAELLDLLPSAAAIRQALSDLDSRREALLPLLRAANKRERVLERARATQEGQPDE